LTNGSGGETTVDETVAGSKIMEKVGVIEVAVYTAIRSGYIDRELPPEIDGDETPSATPRPGCSLSPRRFDKGQGYPPNWVSL